MAYPYTIQLRDYPQHTEAFAVGGLFPTMNGWEVVDVETLPDDRFARVTLWHYGREFRLLMLSTERVACTWLGHYWIEVDKE